MTANVAARGYWNSYTGAFLIHFTVPAEFADYWNGACNSYDCDGHYTYLLGYLVALISTGGCAADPYGICGVFTLLRHTFSEYVGWTVGACLMIMIGYGLIKNQLCQFLYVVDVMVPVIVQVSS